MALLDVKALTMRFGGLTAVSKVDFSVERGQVVSVIGPNGAGKTTVFNAITGVYDPTEGEVLFEGRDLRRPFRRPVVVACALIGLVTGLAAALFGSNVNTAWRAAVVLNYEELGGPFDEGKAVGDLLNHIWARTAAQREVNQLTEIEIRKHPERPGIWVVRSSTNRVVLEEHPKRETAEYRAEILGAMVNLAGSGRTTVKGDGLWLAKKDLTTTIHPAKAEAEATGGTVEPAGGRWYITARPNVVLDTAESREDARRKLFDLAVKTGKVFWRLTNRMSVESLGKAADVEEAKRYVQAIEEVMSKGAEVRESSLVSKRDGRTLFTLPDAEAAAEKRRQIETLGAAVRRERVIIFLLLIGGMAIGAGGAFVVWRRARRTPDVVARMGLARTFQNIRLFPDMLVIENVLMGMDARLKTGAVASALRLPRFHKEEHQARAAAMELLRFVGLETRADDIAKNLPYGDQRRLEIARALATKPELLLLDEPAAGMNPAETGLLMKLIRDIRERGVTVLLIEHHMKVVMGISDRIVVLDYGQKIAEGTPAEVRANPRVIEAYLGKEEVT